MEVLVPSFLKAMSEEQLKAFLEAVKTDAVLQEKLKGAADLDSAVSVSTDAGFEVTQEDWLSAQARNQEMDAEVLGEITGGRGPVVLGYTQEDAFKNLNP